MAPSPGSVGAFAARARFATCTALLLGALAACAGPQRALPLDAPPAPQRALGPSEERFLQRLAGADPRLARRLDRTLDAEARDELTRRLSQGARAGGVVGPALDPFAFAARAAELARARDELTASVGNPGRLAPADQAELALVGELYAAEAARAQREADLTTFGADLLVAVAQLATDATSEDEIGARDAWLAERLGDVSDAVATGQASAMHRRELGDALDPVERGLAGARFPRGLAALAKLREAVGEARMMGEPGPLPAAHPQDLEGVRPLLGERLPDPEIVRVLAEAERALGAQARGALEQLGDRDADAARAAAGKRMALRAPCRNPGTGSLVRSLPAPREREAGCLAVRALAEARADSPRELAEAWLLLHDRVAVALWSAAFHAERVSLESARGRAALLSLPEEATKSALLRKAAVRPADALGAGLVAALVVQGGGGSVARARAIVAYGDAGIAAQRAHLDPQKPAPRAAPR